MSWRSLEATAAAAVENARESLEATLASHENDAATAASLANRTAVSLETELAAMSRDLRAQNSREAEAAASFEHELATARKSSFETRAADRRQLEKDLARATSDAERSADEHAIAALRNERAMAALQNEIAAAGEHHSDELLASLASQSQALDELRVEHSARVDTLHRDSACDLEQATAAHAATVEVHSIELAELSAMHSDAVEMLRSEADAAIEAHAEGLGTHALVDARSDALQEEVLVAEAARAVAAAEFVACVAERDAFADEAARAALCEVEAAARVIEDSALERVTRVALETELKAERAAHAVLVDDVGLLESRVASLTMEHAATLERGEVATRVHAESSEAASTKMAAAESRMMGETALLEEIVAQERMGRSDAEVQAQQRLASLQTELSAAAASLASSEQSLAAAEAQHAVDTAASAETSRVALRALVDEHAEVLEAERSTHGEMAAEEHRAAVTALRRDHAAALELGATELRESRREGKGTASALEVLQRRVAEEAEVVAADVKLMRLDSARAMEASVATRRDLERDLQELRAGHAADVADREEAARALVLREDRHRASIAAMTSEHESVLATKAEMLGVARADADHARTAVGAEAALHDAALAELRASHAAATASMRSEHLAVEESRQRDAHAELETLRAEHGVANFEVSRVSEIAAAAVEGAATVAAELSAAHSELRASSTAHAQLQSALASAKEFGLSEHAAVRDAMEAVGVLYCSHVCVFFVLYCTHAHMSFLSTDLQETSARKALVETRVLHAEQLRQRSAAEAAREVSTRARHRRERDDNAADLCTSLRHEMQVEHAASLASLQAEVQREIASEVAAAAGVNATTAELTNALAAAEARVVAAEESRAVRLTFPTLHTV